MEQLFILFNKIWLWMHMWEINFGERIQFRVMYPKWDLLKPTWCLQWWWEGWGLMEDSRTGATWRFQEPSTPAPRFWRELYQSYKKAPHSAWLQVQIGFPLCSCSTLHLHEVQTSGFNVNRVDFKLNSSLCLCVYEYVCVWNNLFGIHYCFPKSFISFASLQFILVWNTQSIKSLVSYPVSYSAFRTYYCFYCLENRLKT